ncbi:type VII secretion-associated serine protease [Streptomyces sulfonofaciens]|uniref:Type VII secretion-associated serine protease n=1 Tax=Streptomyces sulfonofaciens TaxID=68272 RepID=A0A919GQJ9_9ACTN|nr:type VII secretion-associated serine protease mycosin [Streptomyces sulfonofaciens]GHH88035.1 type VII secretion-associated serine protease [Streptomyces sulfonofaciens]
MTDARSCRPAPGRRGRLRPAAAALLATAASAGLLTAAGTPAAADSGECSFPNTKYAGKPWSLQRVNLDELWQQSTGKGVRVAVIDTGVDVKNPQLAHAVDAGAGHNFLPRKDGKGEPVPDRGNEQGTTDTVGHGTKVAGIIAARPLKGTGFVGLAPGATIIPLKQNDAQGDGNTTGLAQAITYAVHEGADVINISQDTADAVAPEASLEQAVEDAIRSGAVVVASAGNDGLGGNVKKTYPASYPGVLAVAASDRNNERAAFSQSSNEVGVAAPGVDMVSTVPKGGHCSDDGTSFSAPYVAAVAALIKAKHEDWTPKEVVAQIEQTAERSIAGRDRLVGWGVVDPVRALTEDDHKVEEPVAHEGLVRAEAPSPAPLHLGETQAERNARLGTFVTVGAAVLVAALAGTGVAVRDARRRRRRVRGQA